MARLGGTYEDIEERLSRLEQVYGTVTVNQSTFEVEGERYRRVAEGTRADGVDVHVVVHNDTDDVLVRRRDSGWTIPQGTVKRGESPEAAAERIVRESADVDCAVQDVANATIVGICNSEDPSAETLYQLQIVFTAEVEEPPASTTETVRWDDEPNAAGLEPVR